MKLSLMRPVAPMKTGRISMSSSSQVLRRSCTADTPVRITAYTIVYGGVMSASHSGCLGVQSIYIQQELPGTALISSCTSVVISVALNN